VTIDVDVVDHTAVITINRPEARNAVNDEVAQGIEAAIDRLEEHDHLWVGVLTGVPPVFSAGADLKMIGAGRAAELMTRRGGFAGVARRQRSKPLIAAVDGPALAGGTEMVLACDLVVASTTATFGIPEVKRSLVAAGGGLFRLPRRIPLNVAMECALTGDPIDATAAHQFGLVNHLCEPGSAVQSALELAGRITANAPVAVRATRRVVLESALVDEGAAWRLSAEGFAEASASEDYEEGIAAFLEKRSPVWTGR
jgi:enoyl-CoA hydratase/carnithine racemase